MKRNITFISRLFGILLLFNSPTAFAQTTTIGAFNGGSYDQNGVFNQSSTASSNAGDFADQSGTVERRSLLAFNLSFLTKPIASATLMLHNTFNTSQDPSENYELHDVVTPINTLLLGNGGVAGFNDLGNGVVYGSTSINTSNISIDINIPLNSSAIDAMNNSGGLFAIGGSITTLSHFPNNESVVLLNPKLQITLVPEPTSAALIAFAAMIFGTQRSRKRSN